MHRVRVLTQQLSPHDATMGLGSSMNLCCGDDDPVLGAPARKVFIVGATGAIGKALCQAIVASRGPLSVIAAM